MKAIYFLKAVFAVLMGLFLAITPAGFPRVPHQKDFQLVWSDEFDGDTLDFSKWEGHGCNAADAAVRRGSYWNTDMATVKNGQLHIRTEYFPDGYNGNGKPGWYTCGLDTKGLFEPTYGYFEARCILPKGSGLWSAFWMLSRGMGAAGEILDSGVDGAEIDVFESAFYESKQPRRVTSNIHIDGYGEHLKSKNVCEPYVLFNNPYEEFNTYGVEWNEKEYIFYINGIETGRSSFGGTSQTPEYLLLSVEVGGKNAVPEKDWAGGPLTVGSEVTDFVVDYVRAYQYK